MIPVSDFGALWRETGEEVLAAVSAVGGSGWFVLGREVEAFEVALAELGGAAAAVGVGNGLDALEISLRIAGLAPGGRVLTTPLSAFATTLAILRCGAVPVFVDVDATGLLDLELCRKLLREDRTIRYMLPVHLYGHAIDLRDLAALAEELDVVVVEDCAQAIGAASNGRPVGSVGRAAALSFYPTKNLGALGDGGAVMTADRKLEARARALRHYGQTDTYVHVEPGLNSRLDELHAAVLRRVFLPRLPAWTARRREIAATYRQGLSDCRVVVPPTPAGSSSVWHLFPVLVEDGRRDAFRAHLAGQGIATGVHYPFAIPDQQALHAHSEFEVHGELRMARRFASCEVSLPMHPYLSDADLEQVVAAVRAWR